MTYELREGQGSLFANSDRDAGSNRPEWTGNLRIAGQTWRLAAWRRETKAGSTYLSIKATPLERKPEAAQAAKSAPAAPAHLQGENSGGNSLPAAIQSAPARDESDDDIPF